LLAWRNEGRMRWRISISLGWRKTTKNKNTPM
jgi:hypothetical protein